jgi:hypothetical protein
MKREREGGRLGLSLRDPVKVGGRGGGGGLKGETEGGGTLQHTKSLGLSPGMALMGAPDGVEALRGERSVRALPQCGERAAPAEIDLLEPPWGLACRAKSTAASDPWRQIAKIIHCGGT